MDRPEENKPRRNVFKVYVLLVLREANENNIEEEDP